MLYSKKYTEYQFFIIILSFFFTSFVITKQRMPFYHGSTLIKNYDDGNKIYLDESNNPIIHATINNGLELFNMNKTGTITYDHCTITIKNKMGKIIAGTIADICRSKTIGEICEFNGVWVDKKYENQDVGIQVMNALINYVTQKNCSLMQAEIHGIKNECPIKTFVEKFGFTTAATIPILNDVETYIMRLPLQARISVKSITSPHTVHMETSWNPKSSGTIKKKLDAHYKSACSVKTDKPYSIFIISHEKKIIAGAIGNIVEYKQLGKCCKISAVWVDTEQRGHGLGTKIMDEITHYAKNKSCKSVHLETYEWQAKPFYEKCGFSVVATAANVQKMRGQEQYYMKKILKQ